MSEKDKSTAISAPDLVASEEKTDASAKAGDEALAPETENSELLKGENQSAGGDASAALAGAKEGPAGEDSARECAEKSGEEQAPKKRKRNWISFVVSIAIIICVVVVLVQLSETLQQGNTATFAELIAGMNWWYMLIAVGLFVLMFAAESLKYVLLTRCYGNGLSVPKCMKVALIGKYYENITPTATGGQPMQIYYFYKNGMKSDRSHVVM